MSTTRRIAGSVAAAAVAFGALDAVWIRQVALPLYRAGVPHLMASSFDPVPALVFYPAFTCALVPRGPADRGPHPGRPAA